jgi:hypothetical protein
MNWSQTGLKTCSISVAGSGPPAHVHAGRDKLAALAAMNLRMGTWRECKRSTALRQSAAPPVGRMPTFTGVR